MIRALLAEQQLNSMLLSGASLYFETVPLHPSKIDFVARAKALGYAVIMAVIHLERSEFNAARIEHRVLAQVQTSIPLCDQVRVLDNSSADDPFSP